MTSNQLGSVRPTQQQQQQQHRYPPSASTSKRSTHHHRDDVPSDGLLSYIVHTDSHGISDARLQVSQEASSSKAPLRPVYFRERVLTERDEIVDSIVDVDSGRVCWTIHRPTRGWYLYLRSPALPQGTAISVRSEGGKEECDPTASPLMFSVSTRVRAQALERVQSRIASSANGLKQDQSDSASASTSVTVNTANRGLAIHDAHGDVMQGVAVAATGREDRKTHSGGHARRRSGATGSGKHTFDARHPSSSVTRSPMIPEAADDEQPSVQRQSLSRLAIPSHTASSSAGPSPQSSSGADRPYSPVLPSTPSAAASSRTSTFLLTDGRGPTSQQSEAPPPPQQSWARWAYSMLPSEIRPSLSLDADKSFSLYWLDPPSIGGEGAATRESVEVVRFEDQSGRWMWNSHTRGRLTLQLSAMQAVGLQKEFWITAALAYIQFLEDKDAYDAARDA